MGFYDDKKKKSKPVADTPVIQDKPYVEPKEEYVITNPDEQLTNRKYVINTNNNRTSVNTERLKTVADMLKGFAEGSPLTVTYYKQHYSETDVKGELDRAEMTVNPVHKSVLKIHGFEIRLTGPLQYEHNNNEVISRLTGEALTYPGFQPEKGDSFVMEVDTGKYGLMMISEIPQRTSVRAATYYKINFFLTTWLSEKDIQTIELGITDEAWFDKNRFLAEPGALLYHDEYVMIKYLKEMRSKMVQYFRNTFLDDTLMYSYMRPDSIYDPYVTDFMTSVLDFTESAYLATQLYADAPYIKTTVWKAILDKNVSLYAVPTSTKSVIYRLGSKSVLMTSLVNKTYLSWVKSPSLQEYFDSRDAVDSKYIKQVYPKDFKLVKTEYFLTTDTEFKPWRKYYTRSGTGTPEDPYVYTEAAVEYGKTIPANTYYERVDTYGFKDGKTYYERKDGAYVRTTDTTLNTSKTYYLFAGLTGDPGATTTEGEIPPDPSLPSITEGTPDEEHTLGDVLLHLHPHYSECLMYHDETSGSGMAEGEGLGLVLNGTNEHIDVVADFLRYRKLNLKKLRACIDAVWTLPKLEQFYKMPIYIFLASEGIAYIRKDSGIFE